MGALPIRSKHLHVAKSGFNLEPTIRQLTTPEVMIEHYQRLARAYGIEVVTKTSGPLDHFTTTYYKTIRLGADFDEQDPYSQASTWAHEFVHVRQWRQYGPVIFAGTYVLNGRMGWAFEVQAYRETMRALHVLGVPEERIQAYIDGRAERIWKAYTLIRIACRKKDVLRYTPEILHEDYDRFRGAA